MFNGRKLLIATKHAKEEVIAPILEKELRVKCFVPENFDTDTFGTFTGEVERKDDALTTAKNKCLLAMEVYKCDLAISSEGSFGLHPFIFPAYADEEILFFIDRKNSLEIFVRQISADTNFSGEEILNAEKLFEFAERAKFPSHGLIMRKSKDDYSGIVKPIRDWRTLKNTFHHFTSNYGLAYVETDMRAMYNPTRMTVIGQATWQLIEKLHSRCPFCDVPGFEIFKSVSGLPCSRCSIPTRSTYYHVYSCKKCFFTRNEYYPGKKTAEDPMYCDICNP